MTGKANGDAARQALGTAGITAAPLIAAMLLIYSSLREEITSLNVRLGELERLERRQGMLLEDMKRDLDRVERRTRDARP